MYANVWVTAANMPNGQQHEQAWQVANAAELANMVQNTVSEAWDGNVTSYSLAVYDHWDNNWARVTDCTSLGVPEASGYYALEHGSNCNPLLGGFDDVLTVFTYVLRGGQFVTTEPVPYSELSSAQPEFSEYNEQWQVLANLQ